MENILIQLWESSNDKTLVSDGCSLHLKLSDRDSYIIANRTDIENPIGQPTEVKISKKIFDILEIKKSIKVSENEMNNLLGLKDIVVC
jgi:hypothetical protein